MGDAAVLLIHGLGGTQYDLGSMHKRLKRAGLTTYALTLPGHGTVPGDLVSVRAEDWLEAVRDKYHEVIARHETVHLMGMCMGALLAVETAKREHHVAGRLVALAPPVYIDGWATPWYRDARYLLYRVPAVAERMKVMEDDPYGIKNEQIRAIVKAKFARGENFHYGWVPLTTIREVDRLRAMVKVGLDAIGCPTLVIHAREDELTSLRSAHFLVEQIGAAPHAGRARMVVLEDSYHMICIDNDREIVAKHVLEFFGSGVQASLPFSKPDMRMREADMRVLLHHARMALERGVFTDLLERAVAEFSWFQPGSNGVSGRYQGAEAVMRLHHRMEGAYFEAFGAPRFNAGMAVVPATLRMKSGNASPGLLAFAMGASNRLLEARWFPNDISIEDTAFVQ
ncbi:alpha/beta hydrolase [Burkholderia cenocepacia]|uniref:alpha/beta hydrolase n=1 Tax=Burkholderia cenocepacia TaxID=95486 RepID=UPI002AB2F20B|nr:alpha/beta fold hydrolase [Burkholderia cenocepacia]